MVFGVAAQLLCFNTSFQPALFLVLHSQTKGSWSFTARHITFLWDYKELSAKQCWRRQLQHSHLPLVCCWPDQWVHSFALIKELKKKQKGQHFSAVNNQRYKNNVCRRRAVWLMLNENLNAISLRWEGLFPVAITVTIMPQKDISTSFRPTS